MRDFFNKLLIYHKRNFIDGTKANYETSVTEYVNLNNFSSKTQYFIWVDLKNFKVNIFNGSNNKWKMIHSYLCTIGNAWTTK